MAEDKENKTAAADEPQAEPEQAVVLYRYMGNGESYPGVPPGDILKHVYDMQPEWIQRSIAASPLYKAVEPKDKKEKEKEKDGKKESEK